MWFITISILIFILSKMPANFLQGLTESQKAEMLDPVAFAFNYQDEVPNPDNPSELIENPVTKEEFVNKILIRYVQGLVESHNKNKAYEDVEYTKLSNDFTGDSDD